MEVEEQGFPRCSAFVGITDVICWLDDGKCLKVWGGHMAVGRSAG